MLEQIADVRTGLDGIHKRILDGEALAALGTTSSQHCTSPLGGHAGTESMAFSALARVGLVSAFHTFTLSNCKFRASVRLPYRNCLSQ